MSAVAKSVLVEPNADAIVSAVAKALSDIKLAVKAGRPVAEAFSIGSALVSDLYPVIGNIQNVAPEVADDKYAFANTMALGGVSWTKALLS